MAKKKSDQSGCLSIIWIVGFLFTFAYTLIKNLLMLDVMYSYGAGQYFENAFTADSMVGEYAIADKPLAFYTDNKLDANTEITVNTGKTIKYYGVSDETDFSWIAVKFFNKAQEHTGYLLVEEPLNISLFDKMWNYESLKYLHFMPNDILEKKKGKLFDIILERAKNEIGYLEERDNVKKQLIRENPNLRVIASYKKKIFYIEKHQGPQYDAIYNQYLGENFDTQIAQVSDDYTAKRDGVRSKEEGSFLQNLYFQIGLCLIIAVFLARIMQKNVKCPDCKSKKVEHLQTEKISQGFEHSNKDGSRDKRHKVNREKFLIKEHYKCTQCSSTFHDERNTLE